MGSFDKSSTQIDRLDALSVAQLAAEMEQAMDAMTEETYDPSVIDAYLDAIDRKSAIPEYPDVSTAYADFQRRVQAMSGMEVRQAESSYPKPRRKRILRVGLAAVIMVACLLAGVVVAQAAGVDVLGSIAHWTEGVFGFGTLPSENTSTNPSPSQNNVSVEDVDIPEEYNEIHELLSERGLKFYFPQIPAEFEPLESSIYIRPDTNCVDFGIGYLRGDDCIGFYLVQNDGSPSTVYEKDDGPVEEYRNNDIIYYIFTNVTNVTTVWMVDNVEYCITTNSTSVDIKELIHSVQSI